MGSLAGRVVARRPRFLCLHGFRTSGEIMLKRVVGNWPVEVTTRFDLFFADAPFPVEGKSDVDGVFDLPYYEWFQFDKVAACFGGDKHGLEIRNQGDKEGERERSIARSKMLR
ncbi:uncharacterized protein LOC123396523 [Hordeum vulgare subsp. vulgare]|uniref:uncharacterized protein LOC123396523 n=1 Tax=Hordeum vulgare subsp. vulgare TaxID=112509 RepID=UPI001D1A4214|nr:uncharacterized protein LOC123396523 [Hordeum vulgare subsp. vulgare]